MSGSNDRWEFWYGRGSNFGAVNTGTGAITVNEPDIITAQIIGGDGAGATATKSEFERCHQTQRTDAYHSNSGCLQHWASPYIVLFEWTNAEIIQYNRVLSTTEVLQVEGYLAGELTHRFCICLEIQQPVSKRYQRAPAHQPHRQAHFLHVASSSFTGQTTR